MEKVIKTLNVEIKDIDEEERSFTAVASDESIDRDGDRIMASGWNLDNFMKNPVIPWAHRYGEPPVAGAVNAWVDNGLLMFKPKFPAEGDYPFADTIWKLYKARILRAFSVGFRPVRREMVDRGKGVRGWDFMEQELWEISACTVPSNPNALVAAKAQGLVSDEEADLVMQKEKAADPSHPTDPTDPVPLALQTVFADASRKIIVLVAGKDFDLAAIQQTINEFNKNADALADNLAGLEAVQVCLRDLDALTERLAGLGTAAVSFPHDIDPAAIRAATTDQDTEILTPETVGKAIAEALQGIETRIETTVDKRLRYHLGKVD